MESEDNESQEQVYELLGRMATYYGPQCAG